MATLDSRNRMISFRLSPEEYDRFRQVCLTNGIRSLSEMARVAINTFVAQPAPALAESSLDARLANLEGRVQMLSHELRSIRPKNGTA